MELVKYNAMCNAIAEARSVDEVMLMRDKAAAVAAAARIAKNREPEIFASEIRIRAERRLGEMIKAQKETVGLATGGEHGGKKSLDGTREEPSNPRPTLADVGIDKKLSSRAQAIASIPEEDFEETLAIRKRRLPTRPGCHSKRLMTFCRKYRKWKHFQNR